MIAQKHDGDLELAGKEGGLRPTGVPANSSAEKPDPEVIPKRIRRRLTRAYKIKILRTVEDIKSDGSRSIGAYLRKEGLYYSTVSKWAQELKDGKLEERKPGPKQNSREALVLEIKKLRRKLEQTEKKLRKTELIVDLQKKLSTVLGIELTESFDKEKEL
jgi:transposase-like protein